MIFLSMVDVQVKGGVEDIFFVGQGKARLCARFQWRKVNTLTVHEMLNAQCIILHTTWAYGSSHIPNRIRQ